MPQPRFVFRITIEDPDGKNKREVYTGLAVESGVDAIVEAAIDANNWAAYGIA